MAEDIDPEILNTFFTEGHLQLQAAAPVLDPSRNIRNNTQENRTFSFQPTDANEVCRKIYEISSSATGADDIPITFIKLLCPFILSHFEHLFNFIIEKRTFPNIWKRAIITPIPKVSSPSQVKDFRPISVLPAISKVLEKILLSQITAYLDQNPPLLAANQSGYRRGFSTTTALAKVSHDILSGFDAGHCTVMVLVDFSLAFNCVNHHILERKLDDEFSFSNSARELIASFLRERSQSVRVGSLLSTERETHEGTPQGSCLSALLFSLYINSLPSTLKCNWQLYADDLQIYLSGPASNVDQLIGEINDDLTAIASWSRNNCLAPNPKKTQAIIFCKTGSILPAANVTFCGETIPMSNQVINLGLHMDHNLNWAKQVTDTTIKVFSTLRTLRRSAAVLPFETRRKLAQSIIIPFFTYADVVYYPGLSAALKEQLHRCFKAVVRFVHRLRYRETTAAVRNSILGHDILGNYTLRINMFMKRAVENALPPYLQQHLQRGRHERTRNFVIPHHATSSGKSILIFGASSWNRLPINLRSEQREHPFRNALKQFIRTN